MWKNPGFEVTDRPTPDPKEYEVLIRVASCGICGSDTHLYETDGDGYIIFSGPTKLPCTLGHEFSGVVEKTGGRVTTLKAGDKVSVESIMWCGVCQPCRSGAPNQCRNIELMGLTADGAFAEYVTVSERYCWPIDALEDVYPGDKVFEIGALIEPIGCAYNGLFVAAGGFRPGATVVVYGAGPIGLGAVALARIAGASRIIAFDTVDERVKIAADMGADYAFNVNGMGSPPGDKVLELTGGVGADVQVEAAGAAPRTIPEIERSMAWGGKIVYLGRAATSAPMHLDNLVSGAGMVVGARGHSGYGIFPSVIKLIASGRLDPMKIITARYPFKDVLEALKASSRRTDAKVLVNIQP